MASLSIDLTIVRSVGCTGTITRGTTESKLIWVGKTVYGQKAGMPNQWLRGASTDADLQGLISVCQPSSFLDPLLSVSGVSSATRSVTMYHGQPGPCRSPLPETSQDNGKPAIIVVTDTATPLLLNIAEPGSGNFTFTGYGAAKTIAPPAAS